MLAFDKTGKQASQSTGTLLIEVERTGLDQESGKGMLSVVIKSHNLDPTGYCLSRVF